MTTTAIKLETMKALLAIIPTGFFIWTDTMYNFSFLLVLLIGLDTMTGWIKTSGWFCGGFVSTKMFNFKKMISYAIALILFYLVSHIPTLQDSFLYIVWWLSLREAWSVMENLAYMGLKFPQQIVERVAGQLNNCKPKN